MNIIVKLKKIGIILLATLIFFAGSFAIPNTEQKAHAVGFGLAIPGGITLGAGTYALGALGLAGIVGLAGYAEYEEEINAHAKGVWEGGTQTAMDSLNLSIEAARGAGTGLVKLQTDFQTFIDGKLDGIAANAAASASISSDYAQVGAAKDSRTFFIGTEGMYGNGTKALAGMGGAYKSVVIYNDGYEMYVEAMSKINVGSDGLTWSKVRIKKGDSKFSAAFEAYHKATNVDQILVVASMIGASLTVVDRGAFTENYGTIKPKVQEAWEGMKDAGLVLPVDSAVPVSSVDGSPLTYNPTADNYTGIDGGVYEGTPAWAFPQPKIRVANPDIPNSVPDTGVYVDTPVLTGNPAYDDTIINNPAIPKTTTNVQTGVTVGNPDIPNVSNPPIEGEVPPTTPPPSKWEKPPTKKPPNIGALVTTKFPFSLPWDFFGVLGWINAEPKAPVFKLDTGLKTPFGKELKMDMEFKFNFLDPYMGFFRGFIIIGFSLFLILATRRLLGGAG